MTANPAQGIRIERRGPIRHTAAGRIALPLSIRNDGTPLGDADLVMTHDDAVALYADLGRLLTASDDRGTQ